MTALEKLAGITAQHNEIVRRVVNGSLDADSVRKALQAIIEGKFDSSSLNEQPPTWWRSPEQQIARAKQLWGDIQIPEPPANFVPRTKSEVLLLHVPRPFDELWNALQPPSGYTTWRWPEFNSNPDSLRLAPNVREHAEVVWLAFDPEHGKGKRPDSLWGQPNLAASEVLSAIIQFPDWPLSWFNGASAPNMAGYQYKYGTDWSLVPCIHRWGDDRQLGLLVDRADGALPLWASPSVREC